MKRYIILIALAAGVLNGVAQNEVDALRYSRLSVVGTARYSGLGGAFGALGADFSSLSVNPAGIALFRNSEFSITPSLYMANTISDYYGEKNTDSQSNFNLGNIGFVSVTNSGGGQNSSLRKVMFGFGLNRTNNFNNRAIIQGFNNKSSLLATYVDEANGHPAKDLNNFGTGLAYDTYLIFNDSTSLLVYHADMPNGGVTQRKNIETRGSMNEMVFSMGANLLDKFYIGATLGVPYVRYFEQSSYSENDNLKRNKYFQSFKQTNTLSTTGSGINFKLGIIYKPVDFIRIGAAFHTPTYYRKMTDNWSSTIASLFDTIIANNQNSFNSSSPKGEFQYSLTTPLRAIGSIAFIFGKHGLVSADYEYVDYPSARFSPDTSFSYANDAIRNKYKGTGNFRLGTEWKYGQFSFRGGFGLEGDPYKSGINNYQGSSYSFGLGLREKEYYVDLGFVHTSRSEDYYLYDPAYVDPSRNKVQGNSILLTFGMRY